MVGVGLYMLVLGNIVMFPFRLVGHRWFEAYIPLWILSTVVAA